MLDNKLGPVVIRLSTDAFCHLGVVWKQVNKMRGTTFTLDEILSLIVEESLNKDSIEWQKTTQAS